jgi:hypothetical protein
MAANSYRLPTDAANTGVRIRTFQRTIGTAQEENYFHIVHGEASVVGTVAASATNVTLQAANQQRTGWRVVNDSEDSVLFAKLGATASTSSFSKKILPGADWSLDVPYAGIIDGIWTNPGGGAVSGNARVTEITP